MKEQVIAAMLTLSLALGFIYSIEVLAQTNRTTEKSCKEDSQKYCQGLESGELVGADCKCREKVNLP